MAVLERPQTTHDEAGHVEEVPSNVKVLGHPLHPILVTFPIAFLSSTLLADALSVFTGGRMWPRISAYSLTAGIASGLMAATAGALDYFTQEKIRRHEVARYHMVSNAVTITLAFINLLTRKGREDKRVGAGRLLLSLLMNSVLMLGGWFGGELVYKHKIGVDSKR
jgi:uncharacterized membrane protein